MNTVQKSLLVSGVMVGVFGVLFLTPAHAQTSTPTPTPLPSVSPTPVASPLPAELSDYDRDVAAGRTELHKDKADQELRGRVEKIEAFEADEETEPADKIEEDDRNDNEVETEDSVDSQKDDASKPSATDSQNNNEEGN